MSRPMLRWLERALFAIGGVLALWCAVVMIEARHFASLPVPPPSAASRARLPGDASTSPSPTGTSGSTMALAAGSWIARVEAPSVHLSATVLEGTDDGTLLRAAGHIEDTAFPGEAGNVGIAGHRDTTFRPVRHLRVGDPLTLTTADRIYRYRVSKTVIVQPEDVWVLDPADHPMLTLVTCYPFEFIGHAPTRFIVQAVLVGEETR